MNRPGLLLLVLLVLATIGGRFLVKVREAKINGPAQATLPETSAGPESAPPLMAEIDGELESALLNEAAKVSAGRKLRFPEALRFEPSSAAEVQKAWQNEQKTLYPSDTLDRMGLAFQLLGILPPDEDLTVRYRLQSSLSAEALYDAQEGRMLHTDTLDPQEPESREWLVRELLKMLLDQNFNWRESLVPTEVNFDRSLAQRAFVAGDTTLQTMKHVETDVTESHAWRRTETLTKNWPAVLREMAFLGMRDGVHFCQSVSGQDVMLDAVYQQMPSSTAHLLHPDRYLEIPRWEPKKLRWFKLDLLGSEPVWDNVIGELLIRACLEPVTLPEDAGLIAAGWEGDGVLLYQTEKGAPQLAWKSTWRDAAAAERFFYLIRSQAPKLFGVSIPTAQAPTSITYEDLLSLRISLEGETVTLLRWTEDAWRDALEKLAKQSVFEQNKS